MTPRRRARAAALQVLYAVDGMEDPDSRTALAMHRQQFLANHGDADESGRDPTAQHEAMDEGLLETLVTGVCAHRAEIDGILARLSRKWRVERLARVDRNILRIAVFELRYGLAETPARVIINEAVELAKSFGAEEAPAFINGVLDSALEALGITP